VLIPAMKRIKKSGVMVLRNVLEYLNFKSNSNNPISKKHNIMVTSTEEITVGIKNKMIKSAL